MEWPARPPLEGGGGVSNVMAHKHPTHANISLMHILTKFISINHVIQFMTIT